MFLFRRWRTLLLIFVVFLSGTAFGVVGTIGAIRKEFASRMDSKTWTPRTLEWLRTAADLSPLQEEKIRPDVERGVAELSELRDSSDQQRKAIIGRLLRDVALQLDAPQQTKLIDAVKAAAAKPSFFPSHQGSPAVSK